MQLSVGLEIEGNDEVDKLDLRADLESRIYQTQERNKLPKWIVFGSLAVCFIAGLIYLNKDKMAVIIDGPGGTFVHFLKQPPKVEPVKPIIEYEYIVEPRPARPPRPVAVRPEDVTSPTLEQWERERVAKEQEQLAKRQTVFNENNYRPRGATNITKAPTPITTYRQPVQQNQRFRKTHSVPWTWQSYGSGFSKHNKYGQFTYVETERGIDTGSVCKNYKYGSLEYRDCRKAAKKWFQDQCSGNFQQACLAGNMIP